MALPTYDQQPPSLPFVTWCCEAERRCSHLIQVYFENSAIAPPIFCLCPLAESELGCKYIRVHAVYGPDLAESQLTEVTVDRVIDDAIFPEAPPLYHRCSLSSPPHQFQQPIELCLWHHYVILYQRVSVARQPFTMVELPLAKNFFSYNQEIP